jgi:Xaa-Pro aminopeptidase
MSWNQKQIELHCEAATHLDEIMKLAFKMIGGKREVITEFEVVKFILEEFKKRNLKSDDDRLIVAFGSNTSFVHYFPESDSKKLEYNVPIMIDIWGKVNEKGAPFADITWYGFIGEKVPDEIQDNFQRVIGARDAAIDFVKKELSLGKLPVGREVDRKVRDYFMSHNVSERFLHNTGHSLGFNSPHGRLAGVRRPNKQQLQKNLGYTIEPGLYYDSLFGARSEIDFYINDDLEMIITTKVQDKIILI